jgi:4-hydroxy-4-methyl-2-oxoglutarate aldolase
MLVMPTSETERRLISFDTGTLYEAAGEGAFAPGLLAISGEGRVAGPALTVACPPGDNLAIHLAVAQAREGEVLVVQTHDWSYGVWGEVLTAAAMARGIRALVIDGSVRDLDAIRELGFPVYARGTALVGTSKREPGAVRAPVTCCGRLVQPGDLVVADVSGLVAIRPERVEEVLAAAAARRDREAGMLRRLRDGRTTIELLGLDGGPEAAGLES